MISGIGIDLVELERIKRAIMKNERFIKRILTMNEQQVYNNLPTFKRQIEFLAGRFATKEAFAKAAGTGIGKLSFQDIEILTEDTGAPFINVVGYKKEQIFVSISHSKEYAVAQVIINDNIKEA